MACNALAGASEMMREVKMEIFKALALHSLIFLSNFQYVYKSEQ
jgi:hypothetical protein